MPKSDLQTDLPFVETIVTVSSEHLGAQDMALLRRGPDDPLMVANLPFWAAPVPHGWVLRFSFDPEESVADLVCEIGKMLDSGRWSSGFVAALAHCVRLRYAWVRFDADAPRIPGLLTKTE